MKSKRQGALLLLGLLLAQAAWVFAVPPFRGSDEIDHAYRAIAVAKGQWHPTEEARNGRGLVVRVPAQLVNAGQAQCESLPYTLRDNCNPIYLPTGGMAQVATAAGSYNPLYYALVGYAGANFDGSASLYAMRLLGLVVCAALMGAAALVIPDVGAHWTRVGLVAGWSPVLMYSTAIVAPNGLEMAAGVAVWCGLLVMLQGDRRPRGALTVLTSLSVFLLASLRMLGPLWLGLIVLAVAVFSGRERCRRALTRSPMSVLSVCASGVLGVAVGVGWTVLAGLVQAGEEPLGGARPAMRLASRVPVWTMQLVAAFPFRDQPAPAAVYPMVLVVIGGLLLMGLRMARTSERIALGCSILMAIGLPVLLTWATVSSQGVIWQGRYALPFLVGVPLLCGVILDRRQLPTRDLRALISISIFLLAVAHGWSVGHVTAAELMRPESFGDESWWGPRWPWLWGIVAGAGILLMSPVTADPPRQSESGVHEG